jgi:pilus assembly protein CpaE
MISRPAHPGFDADLDQFDAEDEFGFTSSDFPTNRPPPGHDLAPISLPSAALGGDAPLGEASVPRITIHAFCRRAETYALAEKMGTDRRLSRAKTMVRQGGLAEALELYQSQPTPALIIVESLDPAPALLAGLDRLAEVCDPGTKVVLIGAHNDIALYRELIRRGVSEYLVPPFQVMQLLRTVTTLYADPATPFVGRTIAFVGAKGGVGASTLAHNVAYGFAEQMQSGTVLIDYDLPFGTAGLDFNQDPIQGFADALDKPDRLDAVLLDRMTARCTERLSLFAAPASLDDDYEAPAEAYEEVLAKIRTTAPYVVLDLPHTWSGWMRKTLLAADEVVVVAAPDLASLRNAKNLFDLLKKARPNDAPAQLILNQVGVPGRPEIPVKEFAKALGVEPVLCLPFDPKLFGQAANNGQMIQDVNPRAKAAEGLSQFTQTLSRREVPVQKTKSLIERLVKRP